MTKSVYLDIDAVMNEHRPRTALREFMAALADEGYRVVVYSKRPAAKVQAWLKLWNLQHVDEITDRLAVGRCIVDLSIQSFVEALCAIDEYWQAEGKYTLSGITP